MPRPVDNEFLEFNPFLFFRKLNGHMCPVYAHVILRGGLEEDRDWDLYSLDLSIDLTSAIGTFNGRHAMVFFGEDNFELDSSSMTLKVKDQGSHTHIKPKDLDKIVEEAKRRLTSSHVEVGINNLIKGDWRLREDMDTDQTLDIRSILRELGSGKLAAKLLTAEVTDLEGPEGEREFRSKVDIDGSQWLFQGKRKTPGESVWEMSIRVENPKLPRGYSSSVIFDTLQDLKFKVSKIVEQFYLEVQRLGISNVFHKVIDEFQDDLSRVTEEFPPR